MAEISILLFAFVQLIVSMVPFTLHLVGIRLLKNTTSFHVNQKMYLKQISITEILFLVSQNIPLFLKVYGKDETSCYQYASLFVIGVTVVTWHGFMIFLTIDRYFQVRLNITYNVYITTKISKILICINWLVGIIIFISLSLINLTHINNILYICHTYILQACHGTYIVIFISTYVYIYVKIRVGRKINVMKPRQSCMTKRQKTRFVPFWIGVAYILLILLPELTNYVLYNHVSRRNEVIMVIVTMVMFDLGSLVDALIYIYLNELNAKKFFSSVKCVTKTCRQAQRDGGDVKIVSMNNIMCASIVMRDSCNKI